ncbi:dTMP kinase [Sphingorhabdus arenilitoris]|uniref:Thymidylate kinase n=1 Tax=Sphingorhabdus arenilitoris TaxID=1490041 RepID=A0ABV8RFY2_9SPHN
MTKGRFLSVEGGEGVGKSTQISALAKAIRGHGHDVIITREPGGTEGAEAIRSLLLSGSAGRWQVRAEALLFAAARSDHVERLIKPAIDSGKWVISDRFLESSRAYQGDGSGLLDSEIMQLHAIGSGGFLPDRTLILQLDEAEASRRAAQRDGDTPDRIGGRDAAFHAMVHQAFVRFAQEEPDRIYLVDAGGDPDTVTKRLVSAISDLLI